MENLIVVNRLSQNPFSFRNDKPKESSWAVWPTCIRQLALGFGDSGSIILEDKADQIFYGSKAYQFCLEVVAGLHSPMIGETEVHGQFKNFFESFIFPQNIWGKQMRQLVQRILQDSKVIRDSCLKGLGSHTYGSVLRKRLKNESYITFIGAGALVESVLPWIVSQAETITIICRKKNSRVDNLLKKFPKIKISDWNEKSATFHNVVIVAAPVSSREFEAWRNGQDISLRLLIDLRESSGSDPLKAPTQADTNAANRSEVVTLQGFFEEIQKTQDLVALKLEESFRMAEELSARRDDAMHIRPFGWEDLCV